MFAPLLEVALLTTTLAATPAHTNALMGSVRVVGSGPNRQVVLTADGKDTSLVGNFLDELGHLSGSKVEILGHWDGVNMRVEGYRIVDVGQGAKPLVGTLVNLPGGAGSLALADGEGEPVPLSLNAGSLEHLQTQLGAKIWVFGKKLLSGELRVARFGILREPVGRAAPPANGEKP